MVPVKRAVVAYTNTTYCDVANMTLRFSKGMVYGETGRARADNDKHVARIAWLSR